MFIGKTKDDLGPLGTIVSGGIAGLTLWTIIFPADVIKSRQQVNKRNLRLSNSLKIFISFSDTTLIPIFCLTLFKQVAGISAPLIKTAIDIYKREGILALYNGLTPTLIRTFPATGALFFAYEYSKKFMHSMAAPT